MRDAGAGGGRGTPNDRPPDIELTAVGARRVLRTERAAVAGPLRRRDPVERSTRIAEYRRGSKVTYTLQGSTAGRSVPAAASFNADRPGRHSYERVVPEGEDQAPRPSSLRAARCPGTRRTSRRARTRLRSAPATRTAGKRRRRASRSSPTTRRRQVGAGADREARAKRGWEHKPSSRFTASDDVRPGATAGDLRRLAEPAGAGPGRTGANRTRVTAMSTWLPECPDLLTCSTRSQAIILAEEDWYSIGEREEAGSPGSTRSARERATRPATGRR